MSTNPYAAPKAPVAEATLIRRGDFIAGGQGVAVDRGWAWIADAWGLYARRWGLWIGLTIVFGLICMGLGVVPFIGSLVSMLLWPVFIGGLMVGCRVLDEGGELEFAHLFAGFRERTGKLLGIGLFSMVASLMVILAIALVMGAGFAAVMLGSGDPEMFAEAGLALLLAILVMMALLVPVMMATWFAPALVVLDDVDVLEALKASFFGCLKNVLPFLLYGVVLTLFAILASLPVFLGWLVLGPVILASIYTSYRDIYFKRPA